MDAIVYVSESGFTKKYAELLSSKTGIAVYSLKEACKSLAKGSEIVFMGWMMAGIVKGVKKARARFTVRAVCAVGMSAPGVQTPASIVTQNKLDSLPVFYLQGGFAFERLHGIYRFMMSTMKNVLMKQLEAKPDKTPAEIDSLEMMKHGGDHVCEENLALIIAFLNV